MTDGNTNSLNYDDYKQAFQSEFSDFASKFFASPGQGTTDSGRGLIQPPLDLLVLYISQQVNNINNTCTVYMGQEAQGNSTFADYLDGLISGLKSAIPGTGEELPSTSSQPAPAPGTKAVTDSYKGDGPDSDNKGDYLNFYQSCTNFSQLFQPACHVFKNMDIQGGQYYPSPEDLCGGKYKDVADYKLGTLAVFKTITVNGVQADNPYYTDPQSITLLQYMMYTDWITQVYNGSISADKMDSPSATKAADYWTDVTASHKDGLWDALKVNFKSGAFDPNIASTAIPIISKVNYVLSAFDDVKTVNSVTYQSDGQATPTYTKTVDENGSTTQSYAKTLLGQNSQASTFKNNTYTYFFDGDGPDSSALVSGASAQGVYGYYPQQGQQQDLYNSLVASQTLSAGIQGSDNTISQMQNTLNSAMEGNTTQNNTLTAARANSQKLAESTLSTAKQMLTTVAGEGDAFVRNQAVR